MYTVPSFKDYKGSSEVVFEKLKDVEFEGIKVKTYCNHSVNKYCG
jgi:hypothetical protein